MYTIKDNKRIKKWAYLVTAIVVFSSILGFYNSKYRLMNTDYELTSSKIENKIRIVQISDLHNSEFGKNNERLVKMVSEQNPDIIVITGDILNEDEENLDIAIILLDSYIYSILKKEKFFNVCSIKKMQC